MKSGYKTTEFWMTALASIVGLLMTSDLFVADSVWAKGLGHVAAVLASAGYAVSRGMAKRGGE